MSVAPEPPDYPVATRSPRPQQEEGLKVIIEQVLVAFILAFIFRAFVLEAFVIPTGSMAPTLLGAHMRMACPDCGWRFQVNYPTDGVNQKVPGYAAHTYAIRCPNCAYRFSNFDAPNDEQDAKNPSVSYGDRILVLKHAYLFQEPQRWHVVVFKNPSRSGDLYKGLPEWSTEPYQQNYIKRLIGLPGETLMLVDGDVYVTRVNKPPSELSPSDFEIARKGDVPQSALWRAVYIDDHRPQGQPRTYTHNRAGSIVDPPWEMPWRPASGTGWEVVPTAAGGGFVFNGQSGGTLRFDPGANPQALALTDYLAYDINSNHQRFGRNDRETDTFDRDFGPTFVENGHIRLNTVSDLRLSLFYQKHSGDGPLVLRLTKRGDVFEAEIREGQARITAAGGDGQPLFQISTEIQGDFSSPRHVEFINADYRVRLLIDGQTVLETTDQHYYPDIQALVAAADAGPREPAPEVSITAADQSARLSHVSLWRDVYYTARDQLGNFTNPYASPSDFPDNLVRLGDGEYFTLGDNPFLSGDARGWTDDVYLPYEGGLAVDGGRVPERFMLGRAFFVYWPASFRPAPGLPAIVPNFGDMRFIR